MSKTKRKWIVLDYAADGALRAEDIPFDADNSTKDKLDRLNWSDLIINWTAEPVLNSAIIGGEVYDYTYGTTTYYRFVPTTYDSAQDQFFTGFDGTNLTGLIATRGQAI